MASFKPAFDHLCELEGGYVDNPSDNGGETFLGISRKFNPTWPGWSFVDRLKQDHKNLIELSEALIANPLVIQMANNFYEQQFWRFDLIDDQAVANKLFYIEVNFGKSQGVRLLQQALSALGSNLVQDGSMGAKTLQALSLHDSTVVLQYLRAYSFIHRFHVIQQHPDQAVFLTGWAIRDAE